MKNINSLLLILIMLSISTMTQGKEKKKIQHITKWLQAGPIMVNYPAFNQTKNIENKTFEAEELLKFDHLDKKLLKPSLSDQLAWDGKKLAWKEAANEKKNFVGKEIKDGLHLSYFVCYLTPEQYVKTKLKIESYSMIEVYLDGVKVEGKYTIEDKKSAELKADITLLPQKHTLLIKALCTNGKNLFKASIDTPQVQLSLTPKHSLTINDILDGTKVTRTSISPNGKLVLLSFSRTLTPSDKSENWKEIHDISTGKTIQNFKGSDLSQIQWVPLKNSISYIRTQDKKTSIYLRDLNNGCETQVTSKLKEFGYYKWAPNGKTIIYTQSHDFEKEWKIRKIQGMEDRLPGFRTRSNLYKLDINSGIRQKLTFGKLSSQLHDIRFDGKYILFSQSWPDYNEYPYDKQNLYQLNLETFVADTIWKEKRFGGQAQYSPDGSKLLVQGGPSCFGEMGENKGNQPLANNYDGQIYIMDLKTNKVDPITYDFAPSVIQAQWNKEDNKIYLIANDKDYVHLFSYDPSPKTFALIESGVDVIKNINISSENHKIVYTGCGISTPYKAFVMDLNEKQYKVISDPETANFKNIAIGETKDWNFVSTEGKTILGRVYYPPNFNPNKEYPLIVNYYAGTSPVERSFGGRYPLNLYAAKGYVVYLLQPTGAVGFGQEFSAAHQNDWGKTTAREIIQGTKEFIKAHTFIDANHVGCIGASYGGFMTMYLQTQTDIFAAAISHAGISSLSSYWGEGYWGYSYSVNASGHSFPWNNRQLYIDQSPLFNADKIHTPMLLIHGSVDTNVPLGESIQMYQALKLLGRDVEFVQVKGQNHHILNYTQRILWNNTIFAYFAKYLKQQTKWWETLYPEQNL